MQINVKTLTGKTIPINVEHGGSGSMQEVFKQVRDKERIPLDQQRLISDGKQRSFWGTLEQYSIREGDTISLVPRLVGGGSSLYQEASVHLESPSDGIDICVVLKGQGDYSNRWYYTIGPPYSIDILMGLIQTRQYIPMDRQILTYENVRLKEFSTLADYDIEPGRTIYLEKLPPRFAGRKSTLATKAQIPKVHTRQAKPLPALPPPAAMVVVPPSTNVVAEIPVVCIYQETKVPVPPLPTAKSSVCCIIM